MTHIDNLIANALAQSPDTVVYQLAAEVTKLRAELADRVLGEGDRAVGREEWMYLSSLERYARKHGPESIQDVIGCLDHLRAQHTQELAP